MIAAALLLLAGAGSLQAPEPVLESGIWRAWLDSPGGELPFQIVIDHRDGRPTATIRNGTERLPFSVVELTGRQLTLGMPHYDSVITASLNGGHLDGTWVKQGAGDQVTRMAFHARHCLELPEAGSLESRFACRFPCEAVTGEPQLTGRWRTDFESDDDPGVLILDQSAAPELRGTFLTTLGDYRFLAGIATDRQLQLSCFDGAHAFLFQAELQEDGTLAGDFWSRDTWHETWTAVRDPDAALPDAFELTRWNREVPLASLSYPDLDGNQRSLGDPAFAGKARMVQIFGTWCPNCNDEAPYLAELDRRYRERGLSILGLAFEHTGALERDAEQVRRYARVHGVEFPILLAGISDKADASARFPLIDRVRAYPTTLFLDSKGVVRAIHTGFSGPATGAEHTKLREDFERLIETLLAEAEAK